MDSSGSSSQLFKWFQIQFLCCEKKEEVGTEYLIVPSTSHDMVDGGTDTAEGNVLSNIHEFSNRNPGTLLWYWLWYRFRPCFCFLFFVVFPHRA